VPIWPIPSAEEASFKGKEVLYFPVVTGPVTKTGHTRLSIYYGTRRDAGGVQGA
jgi:hypothetical protein